MATRGLLSQKGEDRTRTPLKVGHRALCVRLLTEPTLSLLQEKVLSSVTEQKSARLAAQLDRDNRNNNRDNRNKTGDDTSKARMQSLQTRSYTPPQDHPQRMSGVKYQSVSITYNPRKRHRLARAQPQTGQTDKTFFSTTARAPRRRRGRAVV